jgi:hypothetical protein
MMNLTQDLVVKDTISNLIDIESVKPIKEAQDLHGAERVEDMRVMPNVSPESTGFRVVAGHDPLDDLVGFHGAELVEEVERGEAPVRAVEPDVLHHQRLERVLLLHGDDVADVFLRRQLPSIPHGCAG